LSDRVKAEGMKRVLHAGGHGIGRSESLAEFVLELKGKAKSAEVVLENQLLLLLRKFTQTEGHQEIEGLG
jgi:hypothetical protein